MVAISPDLFYKNGSFFFMDSERSSHNHPYAACQDIVVMKEFAPRVASDIVAKQKLKSDG